MQQAEPLLQNLGKQTPTPFTDPPQPQRTAVCTLQPDILATQARTATAQTSTKAVRRRTEQRMAAGRTVQLAVAHTAGTPRTDRRTVSRTDRRTVSRTDQRMVSRTAPLVVTLRTRIRVALGSPRACHPVRYQRHLPAGRAS